jgi:hypothetical protein
MKEHSSRVLMEPPAAVILLLLLQGGMRHDAFFFIIPERLSWVNFSSLYGVTGERGSLIDVQP